MSEDCLFCRLARREIPSDIVAETSSALAFRDIAPVAPVHILVIPKRHIGSLADSEDDADVGGLMGLAVRVAREQGMAEPGFRVVVNTGGDGGQAVDHLHIHVLGGRRMTWPPG